MPLHLTDLQPELLAEILARVSGDTTLANALSSCSSLSRFLREDSLWTSRARRRWGKSYVQKRRRENESARELYTRLASLTSPVDEWDTHGKKWELQSFVTSPTGVRLTSPLADWHSLTSFIRSVPPGLFVPVFHLVLASNHTRAAKHLVFSAHSVISRESVLSETEVEAGWKVVGFQIANDVNNKSANVGRTIDCTPFVPPDAETLLETDVHPPGLEGLSWPRTSVFPPSSFALHVDRLRPPTDSWLACSPNMAKASPVVIPAAVLVRSPAGHVRRRELLWCDVVIQVRNPKPELLVQGVNLAGATLIRAPAGNVAASALLSSVTFVPSTSSPTSPAQPRLVTSDLALSVSLVTVNTTRSVASASAQREFVPLVAFASMPVAFLESTSRQGLDSVRNHVEVHVRALGGSNKSLDGAPSRTASAPSNKAPTGARKPFLSMSADAAMLGVGTKSRENGYGAAAKKDERGVKAFFQKAFRKR
ncbi:hypothetical protein M427DRAFT_51929 [Gonapodya prolifera JEL478]|uniref:Core-binding (CB) domain-containing protein n=1 Tax=Gonapodya prolifera (strain JEL478) TaxID=1344416 RepID=A0A139AW66_GONPJ|nr:hypothetical protein M427DRAFT_51929 [Gonapodya prolifera JEL478]|eukprot:KXS20976.1 hypothetical protein M427DRAFT_51929 [Gonapodya prolifera JEL478]